MPRFMRYEKVEDVKDVSVFPTFCCFSKKFSFNVNAPVCEDDHGHVAFISEESKAMFLRQRGMA